MLTLGRKCYTICHRQIPITDPTILPYCREYRDTCYEYRKENENESNKRGYRKEIRQVISRVKKTADRKKKNIDNQTKCNEKREVI